MLKPGGKVVVVEFHPLMNIFEIDWTIQQWHYMGGMPVDTGGVGDYVGDDYEGAFKNEQTAYEHAWGVGEVVTALLDPGLTLTHLKEYPYMNGFQRFRTCAPSRAGASIPPTASRNWR